MGRACIANSYSALFLLPENVNGRHRMKKSVGKNHMYIELWFANYAVVCSSYVWLTADEFQIFKHENFVCPCFPAHVFHRIKPRMKNSQHLIEVDQADTGCSLKIVFFSQFTAAHPLHVEEQLIIARDPSVQSLILVDNFCTANSSPVLAKERSQNIETQY